MIDERVAVFGGATVLPDDGAMKWSAGGLVPRNDRLSLIGDPDGGNWLVDLIDDLEQCLQHCVPDVLRIVFDPTWTRKVLRELAVRRC